MSGAAACPVGVSLIGPAGADLRVASLAVALQSELGVPGAACAQRLARDEHRPAGDLPLAELGEHVVDVVEADAPRS